MQVNAVEQRPGNARLVVAGAFGRAAAAQRRIAQITIRATQSGRRCSKQRRFLFGLIRY
jgi:hypothetical protein